MKKMKEMKFHLATGLLILIYYLIFNVTSDLDFTVALSDDMYYVFQVLLVLILGTVATIIFIKSEYWKECGRFQFRWSYLGVFFLSFFFLSIRVVKFNNLYLSSYPEWKCSCGSSHQFDRN